MAATMVAATLGGRPPGLLLLLLPCFCAVAGQDSCPVDVTETGFALNGVAATCPQLTAYCTTSHAQMCTIANKCAVSCGACSSQQFCDIDITGFSIGSEPASCTQLALYCTHATYGPQIRYRCPESCGCGYCPPPSPPAPPLQPSCVAAMELVFVLDSSGSMRAWMADLRQFAYEMALSFVLGTGPGGTQVGVVSFADSATVLTNLTGVSETATGAIDGMLGQLGKTNISDGLVAAEGMLTGESARDGVAKVVMVLTDGQQSNGVCIR